MGPNGEGGTEQAFETQAEQATVRSKVVEDDPVELDDPDL
jgi:hypothetical protein